MIYYFTHLIPLHVISACYEWSDVDLNIEYTKQVSIEKLVLEGALSCQQWSCSCYTQVIP